MESNRFKILLFYSLFLIFGLVNVNAQLSKIHYIPPLSGPPYPLQSAPDAGQYLYISTPSVTNVNVVITPIGGAPEAFINMQLQKFMRFRLQVIRQGALQAFSGR